MIGWLIGWMEVQRGQVICLMLAWLCLGWSLGRMKGWKETEDLRATLRALSADKVNILYTRALEEQIRYLNGMVRKGQALLHGQDKSGGD